MFRKLLEAVLRTGNHMNVGTNRGDAQAFKLDSLLKLVDIKGTDRKTTLLHFVVQEIIRTEGARLACAEKIDESTQQSTLRDEIEFRKLGLQVVCGLSGELTNVKKAATMDADLLSNEVSKLASGVTRITKVIELNKNLDNKKFTDLMSGFLNKAEGKIVNVQAQEGIALSMVKGLTEFFHGDSAMEEAHPFRLFMVVRDFLSILDRVCKDVSKINERTMVSSGQQVEIPANPISPQGFAGFISSSDDENQSSL